MNVVILTPDSVGSTFLQRTLTVYMQLSDFDRPVINLHELTNGLVKYYSPEFNQEILGKKDDQWGYHQSLSQVTELLSSVDHYKTSRLAQYHIIRRNDSLEDQINFYNYLNDNFYVISCNRQNVFEHALSRTLAKATGKLNVYTPNEKIDTFYEMYRSKIKLDQESLLKSLEDYKNYISWCNYFEIASYFNYESDVSNVENFVLDLPFMTKHTTKTFEDTFNITFNDWNKCHYLAGDIGSVVIDNIDKLENLSNDDLPKEIIDYQKIVDYNSIAAGNWPAVTKKEDFTNLPDTIKNTLQEEHNFDVNNIENKFYDLLPKNKIDFFSRNIKGYTDAMQAMNKMTELGIMISPPPMKKQTLAEKQFMIKNFQECVDTYNRWQNINHNIAKPVDNNLLDTQNKIENNFWQTNHKLLK